MLPRAESKRRPPPLKVDTTVLLPVLTPPGSSRFQEDFDAPFSEVLIGLDISSDTANSSPSHSRPSLSAYDDVDSPTRSPTSIIFALSWMGWRSPTGGKKFKEWAQYPLRKLRRGTAKPGNSKEEPGLRESRHSLQGPYPDGEEPIDTPEPRSNNRRARLITEAWWKFIPAC